MSLELVPISFREAKQFIDDHHRHHKPPTGHKFSVGVRSDGKLVGVASCGRPVARHYDDGATLEVNRTATDGTFNANSMLYGACKRAAKALGYRRLITYTMEGETGASLRAAGWTEVRRMAPRRGWSVPSRPRDDHGVDGVVRILWEVALTTEPVTVSATELENKKPVVAIDVVDLFAGPGGWDVAAEEIGLNVIGIEYDHAACDTRRAANHLTMETDVRKLTPIPAYGLIASPPCFPAGTPVLTARGLVAIEDVAIGDLVLTHQGRWREVTATMSRESDVISHSWLASTPDHPFWTRSQSREWNNDRRAYDWSLGDPEWTHAEKMQGSFIALPNVAVPLPVPSVPRWSRGMGAAFWQMVGRWVADGWTRDVGTRHEVVFGIGKHKAEAFRSLLEEVGVRSWEENMRTSQRFTFHHLDLPTWLVEHFGYKAAGKTLPGWLFGADEEIRRAFLDGYLAGDGHQEASGWSCVTASFNLAVGLRVLATTLGYTTSIVKTVNDRQLVIEGRPVNELPTYRVTMNVDDGRYTRTIGKHRWVKARKPMTPRGVETVYDITVEEDHSFVAYGYVVHNCQSFSSAGKGEGRKALDEVKRIAHALVSGADWRTLTSNLSDERTGLVLEPLHWAFEMQQRGTPYRWIAMEQVPTVLPLWKYYVAILKWMGYSATCGYLQAEQYGVAQTRKRAILVASLDHEVKLPEPTHSKFHVRSPQRVDEGVDKWVSMAEALGWGMTERPSMTVTSGGSATGGSEPFGNGARTGMLREESEGRSIQRSNYSVGGTKPGQTAEERGRTMRDPEQPSVAITSKGFQWMHIQNGVTGIDRTGSRPRNPETDPAATITGTGTGYFFRPDEHAKGSVRVTIAEAAMLQSFPPDYPWQGGKGKQYEQVGNAVPPLLALAVLGEVTDTDWRAHQKDVLSRGWQVGYDQASHRTESTT